MFAWCGRQQSYTLFFVQASPFQLSVFQYIFIFCCYAGERLVFEVEVHNYEEYNLSNKRRTKCFIDQDRDDVGKLSNQSGEILVMVILSLPKAAAQGFTSSQLHAGHTCGKPDALPWPGRLSKPGPLQMVLSWMVASWFQCVSVSQQKI